MKPTVKWKAHPDDRIRKGKAAFLKQGTVDHYSPYCSNSGQPVLTSIVLAVNPSGFETLNTIYEKVQ